MLISLEERSLSRPHSVATDSFRDPSFGGSAKVGFSQTERACRCLARDVYLLASVSLGLTTGISWLAVMRYRFHTNILFSLFFRQYHRFSGSYRLASWNRPPSPVDSLVPSTPHWIYSELPGDRVLLLVYRLALLFCSRPFVVNGPDRAKKKSHSSSLLDYTGLPVPYALDWPIPQDLSGTGDGLVARKGSARPSQLARSDRETVRMTLEQFLLPPLKKNRSLEVVALFVDSSRMADAILYIRMRGWNYLDRCLRQIQRLLCTGRVGARFAVTCRANFHGRKGHNHMWSLCPHDLGDRNRAWYILDDVLGGQPGPHRVRLLPPNLRPAYKLIPLQSDLLNNSGLGPEVRRVCKREFLRRMPKIGSENWNFRPGKYCCSPFACGQYAAQLCSTMPARSPGTHYIAPNWPSPFACRHPTAGSSIRFLVLRSLGVCSAPIGLCNDEPRSNFTNRSIYSTAHLFWGCHATTCHSPISSYAFITETSPVWSVKVAIGHALPCGRLAPLTDPSGVIDSGDRNGIVDGWPVGISLSCPHELVFAAISCGVKSLPALIRTGLRRRVYRESASPSMLACQVRQTFYLGERPPTACIILAPLGTVWTLAWIVGGT
ncbi:hypothetical protein AG1IA_07388 [Rhizoctonia solani AG-1 IA]|uniref:Uncharacterized protein n=1 Tax=Thanatephorus cucumeris (strain AG1-IA) TaxID=983506 RepID=L8WQF4_THACA|nr:hypothetical protein AG1IA_07388 [Rhizoctonia solani AG-1 IA]